MYLVPFSAPSVPFSAPFSAPPLFGPLFGPSNLKFVLFEIIPVDVRLDELKGILPEDCRPPPHNRVTRQQFRGQLHLAVLRRMPTQLEMVSPELPVTGYQVRESRYYEFKAAPHLGVQSRHVRLFVKQPLKVHHPAWVKARSAVKRIIPCMVRVIEKFDKADFSKGYARQNLKFRLLLRIR